MLSMLPSSTIIWVNGALGSLSPMILKALTIKLYVAPGCRSLMNRKELTKSCEEPDDTDESAVMFRTTVSPPRNAGCT